ncbi:DUF1173 family protein [Actinomadura sp. BRA 177]|nr:DUF1173 family protein [Actinomadura sp. BRA 177]
MAAMLTNYRWIPADTSYEVAIADHLITAGRSFTKPPRIGRRSVSGASGFAATGACSLVIGPGRVRRVRRT